MKIFSIIALLAIEVLFSFGAHADLAEFPEGKRGAIAFTFDDGTVDQYEVAAPVLDKYGIKAIFNIIPSRIGTDDAKYMTWDQVRDLVKRGHALGNHTLTHRNLNALSEAEVEAEIVGGYEALKKWAGYDAKTVCYPYNASGPKSDKVNKKHGFKSIAYRMDNWGGKFAAAEAHKVAEKILADKAYRYVLIHGLRPGGGWAPLNKPEQFEEIVKALLEHKDLWVAGYDESVAWREAYRKDRERIRWENEQLGRYAPHAFRLDVTSKGGWNAVRKCGEEVTFEVGFRPCSSNILHLVKGQPVTIRLDDFGGTTFFEKTLPLDFDAKVELKGTLAKPGFLRLSAEAPGLKPNYGAGFQRSVAFETEKITKVPNEPCDFDAFWAKAVTETEKVPLDPDCELVPKKSEKTHNTYLVSFATMNDRRVYGYLMVPKSASAEKKCPLVVQVPGAGMGSWTLWPHPEKDAALLFMTVFPWAPSDDTGAQNAKYKAFLKEIEEREGYHHYYLAGVADDPAQAFYVPVILGANRAIDWAAARPEIDETRVVYYGISQGGAFGLYLAQLNKTIARAVVNVPAFSDLRCGAEGRMTCTSLNLFSFDDPVRIERAKTNCGYLDTANFAARIAKPIVFVTGLGDWVCPPATVFAAYNACPSADKQIWVKGGDHNGAPDEAKHAAMRWLLNR